MGRSLGELNSGAENAKQVTGYEGIIKAPAEGKTAKKPAKEEVLQRYVDETPMATAAPEARKPISTSGPRGAVPQGGTRARTRDVTAPFHEIHSAYTTLINNSRSMKLGEDHQDAIDVAAGHMMNSAISYHKAMVEGGLHTNGMNVDIAHGHLQDAVEHLTYAHETLVQSGVHSTLASRNLNAPIPSDDKVADLVGKSQTLERRGAGGVAGAVKPYKKGLLGRTGEMTYNRGQYTLNRTVNGQVEKAEFSDKDVNDMARTFGRNHPGVQKFIAMRGTQRGKTLRVSADERREGIVKATGAGVATGGPNPKARGRGVRVDTEYRTDANPSNNTGGKPRF